MHRTTRRSARQRLRLFTALVSIATVFQISPFQVSPAFAQSVWKVTNNTAFSNDANWTPAAPGAGDDAVITSGTADVGSSAIVNRIDISGGRLRIGDELVTVDGAFLSGTGGIEIFVGGELSSDLQMTGGTLSNSGTITGNLIATGGSAVNDGTIAGTSSISNASLTNNGTLGTTSIGTGGILTNNGGATAGAVTNAGTVNNNGTLGAVDNTGTFTNNTTGTAGAVTNAGTAANAGTVASLQNTAGGFTNNGTVTGSTEITGGSVTNNAVLANVDNGTGAIFTNNTTGSAGTVSNAGTASNAGTITVLRNAAGSFTNNNGGNIGNVEISGGTVTNNYRLGIVDIRAGGSLSNNTGASTGAVSNAGTVTNAGVMSSLLNTGGSFTNNAGGLIGAVTISGGSVTNNATMANVNVLAGGSFINNAAGNAREVTSAGIGANAGNINSLHATGGSFTNSGTIKGTATVSDSTLVNDGTIQGAVSLYTGGLLSGTGRVGSLLVGAGATLSPGPGIATTRVNGNLIFSVGSNYQLNVDALGNSDLVTVGGTATINGGTVEILAGSGTYSPLTQYTILTATGGLTGMFDTVTSDLAFLSPYLDYTGNAVTLDLRRNIVAFADVTETRNNHAVADAIEALGPLDPLFLAVLPLDAPGANSAFGQLNGEIHASAKSLMLEDSRFIRDAILDRINGSGPMTESEDGETTFWTTAFGSTGHLDGDGNASRMDSDVAGVIVGADAALFDNWRLGMLAGYSHRWFDKTDITASGEADSYHAALYAAGEFGPVTLTGGATYSNNDISTDRSISFGNFNDRLKADYDSGAAQVFADLSWRIKAGEFGLTPFANLAHVQLRTGGFGEEGGAAALDGQSSHDDLTVSTFGLRWMTELPTDLDAISLYGMFGWRHAFGDLTPASSLAFAGSSSPFTIYGTPLARDVAVVEAGIEAPIAKTARLRLAYTGEFAHRLAVSTVNLELTVKF